MLSLWDPFAGMTRLHDTLLGRVWREDESFFRPSVDVVEEDKAYRVKADLPGMTPGDIKLELKSGVLTISGERKVEKKEEAGDGYQCVEREFGAFSRSFILPETVETDHIDAAYKDGVLTVTIPKRPAAASRQIKIETH
jgi:HSP20 family protein